jgi:hypothetical protein
MIEVDVVEKKGEEDTEIFLVFFLPSFRPSKEESMRIVDTKTSCLRSGLLLLLLPQSRETDTRDLDDLETDTGNITLGLALATETGEKDLVVLVDKVQTTIVGDW